MVSTLVHTLLGAARLPRHLVKPVQIRFAAAHHVKYGAAEIEAFLYSFSDVDLIDVFDLRQTELSCTVRLLSARPQHDVRLAPGSVDSGAAAFAAATKLTPAGMLPWVTPAALHGDIDFIEPQVDFSSPHFPLHIKDLDLVFFDHFDEPLVSDGLRDALVCCQAQGMTFSQPWDSARVVVVDADPSRAGNLLALAAGLAPNKKAKTAAQRKAQKKAP